MAASSVVCLFDHRLKFEIGIPAILVLVLHQVVSQDLRKRSYACSLLFNLLFQSWRGRRDWQRERYRKRRRYIEWVVGSQSLGGMGDRFGSHGRTIGAFGRFDILFVLVARSAETESTMRTAR